MVTANAVDPKTPDKTGKKIKKYRRDTTPVSTTTMSYSYRLKSNVRHNHRLKRNVLKITIEKS